VSDYISFVALSWVGFRIIKLCSGASGKMINSLATFAFRVSLFNLFPVANSTHASFVVWLFLTAAIDVALLRIQRFFIALVALSDAIMLPVCVLAACDGSIF
jgi:hypothetical protein